MAASDLAENFVPNFLEGFRGAGEAATLRGYGAAADELKMTLADFHPAT
jgi:hypothetical protein